MKFISINRNELNVILIHLYEIGEIVSWYSDIDESKYTKIHKKKSIKGKKEKDDENSII
jgi:hypothetical protein